VGAGLTGPRPTELLPLSTELLPRSFFARPAVAVAPDLLGCVLRHESADGPVAVIITEAEAYAGSADPASHAFRGRTPRNAVMFGEPGHAYVYFTYGMHYCVNLICMPAGTAEGVLLRAGRVIEGAPLAASRRQPPAPAARSASAAAERDLARGPARLCRAMGIDRAQDGADACDPRSPLQVLARAIPVPQTACGPRVGVSQGAESPWRFWIAGDPTVSPYRAHVPKRRPGPAVSRPG
jgi:DNA-3-methyladenine glycosylase